MADVREERETVVVDRDGAREPRSNSGAIVAIIMVVVIVLLILFVWGNPFGGTGTGTGTGGTDVQIDANTE